MVAKMVSATFIMFIVLVAIDWQKMYRIAKNADGRMLLYALFFAGVSYAATTFAFISVCHLFHVRIGWAKLFLIGFFTIALNNVFTVVGYGIRMSHLKSERVYAKDVLAASLLHASLVPFALFACSPFVFAYIFFDNNISRVGEGFAATAFILVCIASLCLTLFFFMSGFRMRVLKFTALISKFLSHRPMIDHFMEFDDALSRGMVALRHARSQWFLLFVLIAADLAGSILALWFCFYAFKTVIHPGSLLIGFFLGILAGLISMVPGGLGVQEGSIAGVLTFFGVALERGVLASILFRTVYYFVPLAVGYALHFWLNQNRTSLVSHERRA